MVETGSVRGTRSRRVKPQVVDLSAPSVGDTMVASVGKLWGLALVVVRWIIQLGTVQGHFRRECPKLQAE
ncbi:hypothetical protein F2Q68_00039175 [Brassica cretica]|uniref:Uncharacterized protein n=1 Tax=Brassica cretica TaxID=69181 RepID=A0A8S9MIE6_BRACR|nr:hypothetical protein F2Q68_00039175 [Brassica cretica]